MKFILVRHAETTANSQRVILGGAEDGSLSERGMRQADALRSRLSRERFAAIYCSPTKRTKETCARIVADSPHVPIHFTDALREINMGEIAGLSYEQCNLTYPNIFHRLFEDPTFRLPGGESISDVQQRVSPLLQELAALSGNPTILAVGHNIVNRVIIATLIGLPLSHARSIKQKNAAIAVIDVTPHGSFLYTLDNSLHAIR